MSYQKRIVRGVEAAFVAYLEARQAAAELPDGFPVHAGHGSANLDAETARLVVTAYRPRRWLSCSGNYKLDLQIKFVNAAGKDGAMDAQDEVIGAVEALLSIENRATVLAALNASTEIGVNYFADAEQGHEEARDTKWHGTALDFEVEAWLRVIV